MNGILHRKWPNGFKYHSYIMEVKLGVQLLRPFWRQWALTILLCPIRTWKLYKPPKAQKYEATLKRQSWHYYLYLYFWPLFKNWGINLAFSKRRVTKLKKIQWKPVSGHSVVLIHNWSLKKIWSACHVRYEDLYQQST